MNAIVNRHTKKIACANFRIDCDWLEEGEEYGYSEDEDAIYLKYIGLGNPPRRTVNPFKHGRKFSITAVSDIPAGTYDVEVEDDMLIIYKN